MGERYRIVAPDLAGFGSSDKPDISYERSGHLADIHELVTDEEFALVGHSLGGVLAALLASADPDRVRRLALAAPPFPLGTGPDYRRIGDGAVSLRRRVALGFAKVALPLVSFPVGLARGYPPQIVRDFTRQTLAARGGTMWSLLTDPTVRDDLARLRRLDRSLPCLIVHARDDRTVPPEAHDRWTTLMPHADARMIDAGGHQFLLRDNFEPVAAWLAAQRA